MQGWVIHPALGTTGVFHMQGDFQLDVVRRGGVGPWDLERVPEAQRLSVNPGDLCMQRGEP